MPAINPVASATFSFQSHNIRVISKNGEPWFVAKDICEALELTNPTEALKPLDEDERAKFNLGRSDNGGGGEVNVINESGLYTLILRSRQAITHGTVQHTFRKWVTSEVLPQIRKTGAYQPVPPAPPCAARLHHPHTSPDVPIRTTTHKGATWYRLGDVGWQLGVDAYLLARHIPGGESALLKVRDKRYGWQRCWWASARGIDAVLHACDHKPAAARVREYLQLPAALPAPQPSLAGLPDGRYLLVVEGGLPHLRDIRDKAVVDNRFVWALRRNFKTLSEQMRLLTGEAGECVLDLQLHDLQEVQA